MKLIVLERIISNKKGSENLKLWKDNLLNKEYELSVIPRIGSLRAQWKIVYNIDLNNLVQPLLFRVLCSYLDQGISLWKFPVSDSGFLSSIRELEKTNFTSFFKTKRAKTFLMDEKCDIVHLLKIVVGRESFYEQYIFDQEIADIHAWLVTR